MITFILKLILSVMKTEATKELIGLSVNRLLEHKEDGITKDVAKVMIDGISKSKMNPTTDSMFTTALKSLDN